MAAGTNLFAAALLGLVVHWRIYPVIFALPIWLFLPGRGESPPRKTAAAVGAMPLSERTANRSGVSAAAAGGALRLGGSGRKALEPLIDCEGASLPHAMLRGALDLFSRCEVTAELLILGD